MLIMGTHHPLWRYTRICITVAQYVAVMRYRQLSGRERTPTAPPVMAALLLIVALPGIDDLYPGPGKILRVPCHHGHAVP